MRTNKLKNYLGSAFLLIFAAGLPLQAAEILEIGNPETVASLNGVRPSIDTDSKGQPHIVIDTGLAALGNTLYMYNKIGGNWSGGLFADRTTTPYAPSAISQPWIEIDSQDRAWIFAQFFQAGVLRNSGQALWLYENMDTGPSLKWFNKKQFGLGWGPGNVQIDPQFPEEAVIMTINGAYGIVNSDGVTTETGTMGPRASGEKFRFRITPRDGQRGVWHGVMNGSRAGGSSAYRSSVDPNEYVWATYNPYSSQGDDHNHPGVTGDLEDPQKAYIAAVFERTGKFVTDPPGLSVQVFDGANKDMLRGTDNLLMVDPEAKFVNRNPPAITAAKGGGAWIAWATEDNHIKMTHIRPDATKGENVFITNGAFVGINTDNDGNVHMAYVDGGQVKYRKIMVSGAGSSISTSMAADFDGDGLDDLAVFDAGTWHIRGTDDGGFKGYRGVYIGKTVGTAGDLPVPADFDGDGKADPATYTPNVPGGKWSILRSSDNALEVRTGIGGNEGDIPVPADYDGDGRADIAVWDINGTWHIARSTAGYTGLILGNPANGDTPVPGDYDGDGIMDLAVFQPNGVWHISGTISGYVGILSGTDGDIPAPQDYNNDGFWETAVFRPSTGEWIDENATLFGFGTEGDLPVPGRFYTPNSSRPAVYRSSTKEWIIQMNGVPRLGGGSTDFPVPGNWGGDARADIAIYRNSDATWHFKPTGGGATQSTGFGLPGDWGTPGDYDNDGTMDLAVYRGGTWFIDLSNGGTVSFQLGSPSDIPRPADFDGDGKTDIAVYGPSNGVWHVSGSTDGYFGKILGGNAGDFPIPMDVNNDGRADTTIFDASAVFHSDLSNGGGYFGFLWGAPGMIPVTGIFKNQSNANESVALYDQKSRTFYVYPGVATFTMPAGSSNMVPVVADYDNDGIDDFATFRSSTGEWFIRNSSDGSFSLILDVLSINWSTPGGTPIGVRQ